MKWPWVREAKLRRELTTTAKVLNDKLLERIETSDKLIESLKKENEALRDKCVEYYLASFPKRQREAFEDWRFNQLSIRQAAIKNDVPYTTLWNKIKKMKLIEGERSE